MINSIMYEKNFLREYFFISLNKSVEFGIRCKSTLSKRVFSYDKMGVRRKC